MFPIYPGFTYGGSMSILHSYILHLIRIQGLVVNQEVDTNNDIFVILLQITRQSSKCSGGDSRNFANLQIVNETANTMLQQCRLSWF
jgi:hypothetical protein